LAALDKATGKETWHTANKIGSNTLNTVTFEMNGNGYAFALGNFISLKDGKSYLGEQFVDPGLVIDGNMAYCLQNTARTWWYKLEPQSTGDLKVTLTTPTDKTGYNRLTFPLADE